jgi:CheY-like chemotaxis protein
LPGLDAVPAIAISGYASDEDRTRALAVGYAAFFAKPIDSDELFGIVGDLVPQGGSPWKRLENFRAF